MAKTKKQSVILGMDLSVTEAQKHLDAGEVSAAQFGEWLIAKAKLAEAKPAKGKGGKPTSGCEVTRKKFFDSAKGLKVVIGDHETLAEVKAFSAKEGTFGSFGWMGSGKIPVRLADGSIVRAQLSLNIIVVNSKNQKD